MEKSNKSNKLSLKACANYKLNKLQELVKQYHISVISEVNGKSKNKTKRSL